MLTERDFREISRLAKEEFGLDLRKGKEELVAARLGKKVREGAFPSIRNYYRHVLDDRTGEALIGLIDALATNHTSFYREPAHFEFLRSTALPGWHGRPAVEVWSAACSTGEEPYSIAFTVLDALEAGSWRPQVRILATDISTKALTMGSRAIYPADRFEGCPPEWPRRYLLKGTGQWQGYYRVKPEIVKLIRFERLNLVRTRRFDGSWPLIFCRNVMIYFDRPTQEDLVGKLSACLDPGGYLLVGHAESLTAIEHPLGYVKPAVYRKPGSGR